jgi:hypothetical protein
MWKFHKLFTFVTYGPNKKDTSFGRNCKGLSMQWNGKLILTELYITRVKCL